MENIKIEYENHCSSYNLHPPCNPPCMMVRARIVGYANKEIVTEWFNPHFINETGKPHGLPTSLINLIKADFAPAVWGVDLHG